MNFSTKEYKEGALVSGGSGIERSSVLSFKMGEKNINVC